MQSLPRRAMLPCLLRINGIYFHVKDAYKATIRSRDLTYPFCRIIFSDRYLKSKIPRPTSESILSAESAVTKNLEKRVHTDSVVAFAMYPTSIQELFDVADAHLLMPPKSTWFEPKLRSGLFIHSMIQKKKNKTQGYEQKTVCINELGAD